MRIAMLALVLFAASFALTWQLTAPRADAVVMRPALSV